MAFLPIRRTRGGRIDTRPKLLPRRAGCFAPRRGRALALCGALLSNDQSIASTPCSFKRSRWSFISFSRSGE